MMVLYVALGGALGAVSRYLCTTVVGLYFKNFPYGTLFVNTVGAFLIGVVTAILSTNSDNQILRALIITGFLGGFTTFSSFSLETFKLITSGNIFLALVNIFANLALCLLMTSVGYYICKASFN